MSTAPRSRGRPSPLPEPGEAPQGALSHLAAPPLPEGHFREKPDWISGSWVGRGLLRVGPACSEPSGYPA